MTTPVKNRVAVLGLGLMGSAVARRLIETGWNPVVWNRTPEKAAPLFEAGAKLAKTAMNAWSLAEVIFMIPIDYAAGFEMLGGKEARPDLRGKTFVQFASGSAAAATEFSNWLRSRGAKYLDGNIYCYPPALGSPDSMVVYCGDEDTF